MKKLMFRVIALMLSAVLCLTLAGCAPKDEMDFERACALMDAGEYEAAIEAFSAIGLYREISDKIDEAEALLEEENCEFLYGDWVDVSTKALYTFSKGGTGKFTQLGLETEFTYTSDGKRVLLQGCVTVELKADKEDGTVHLRSDDGLYDLVPQEDFVESGPVTVEITLDNWETYFECRRTQDVGVDSEGKVNFRETGYGIFLKPEYLSKVDPGTVDGAVTFEVTHEYRPNVLEGDLDTDDYTLTPVRMPKELEQYRGSFPASETILNRGYQLWRSPESEFNNAVCAFLGDITVEQGELTYLLEIDDVKITGVTGSLTLLP